MFVSLRIFFASVFSRLRPLFYTSKISATGPIYDLEAKSLGGQMISFSKFRGKKLLIVNTASKCGFTSQYQDLQRLHENFHDRLVVVGFPSNDFLWQEPGNNEEIASFCSLNFGVTFQMFEKISVKGRHMHPIYRWLAASAGVAPSWNFCKYLIDENGQIKGFFEPKIRPLDRRITNLL